jgi:catechol 2,3-dioxygenase-like lactoylglutathione lyase family enzyme
MFNHIGLRVSDVPRSVRFYQQLLAPLGFELCMHEGELAGFGKPGEPRLWLHGAGADAAAPRGVHVAFEATSRAAVERFHHEGIRGGGVDNGKPGLRSDYSPTYYAAFLIDPDGNNIEAVCMHDGA